MKPGCKFCPQKEVHMVRHDGFNHVRDSIWRRHLTMLSLRGQDGRVVKASFFYCEMPMVTRGIESRLQILSSKRSSYGTSRWFQSRPRFYMAPASADIFRAQDGRVVKASFFYCEMPMVTRGIETRLQILSSKRSPYGTSRWFQSRPQFYMAPVSADI